MLKVSELSVSYNNEDILHDINLNIHPNTITIIIGPNGSGKSTLFKSMIRLNTNISGTILINDENISSMSSSLLAQKIAYLPQGKKVPDIQVQRMVLHGRFPYLKYPRRYRKEDYDMVNKSLKWVGIENLADRNVNQLSGGTQQKVYIAMALAQDTPIILMDEPTTYLDIAHQIKLMDLAKSLAAQGRTVLMVLHDLTQAFSYADRIVVMSEGRIVLEGIPEEIFNHDIIFDVFKVKINRIMTDFGWRYFYE